MAKRSHAPGDTPPLEWLTGGLGVIIFGVMLAVLINSAINGANAPPDVRATVERISVVSGGYIVEFEALNSGDVTAADVTLAAELANGERSTAHFDYLPPHSARHGGVFFRSDPRAGHLSLRAEGYSDP